MPFEIDFEDPRIGFASAHFIIGHDKCGRLHGHNYFIKVKVKGELNEQHMVLDYGILKEALRKLTKPFDHKVLIPTKTDDLEFIHDIMEFTPKILLSGKFEFLTQEVFNKMLDSIKRGYKIQITKIDREP